MMLDTFFIAVEAFDIGIVQLPVVGIKSRMGIKAIGSSGKALGIWKQNINTYYIDHVECAPSYFSNDPGNKCLELTRSVLHL
jgi:hypothetical protein